MRKNTKSEENMNQEFRLKSWNKKLFNWGNKSKWINE